MSLSDAEVSRLLVRCARQRRVLFYARLIDNAFEVIWPGAIAVLIGLAITRALRLDLRWVPYALGAWIAVCAYRLVRTRASLEVPRWFWVAYADRNGAAGGSLMRRFEAGSHDAVPLRVRDVRIAAPLPWRSLCGALAITAAYAVCVAWPVPPAARAHTPRLVPLPVERVQQVVAQIVPRDPEAKAFVAAAHKSLQALEAKPGGLRRPDFDALDRIEKHARKLLEGETRAQSDAQRALDALQSLVASQAAASGTDERAAGALRDAAQRAQEDLARAGIDSSRFQEMLQRAQRNAERQGGRARAASGEQRPFGVDAVRELQREIGRLREQSRGDGQGQKGGGGVDRGPGTAPIDFAHEPTWIDGAQFEVQTFQTHPDRDTVLLSSAFTKRDETPKADPLAQSNRNFEPGDDSEFWDKHLSPSKRALLQRYFGADEPHD